MQGVPKLTSYMNNFTILDSVLITQLEIAIWLSIMQLIMFGNYEVGNILIC